MKSKTNISVRDNTGSRVISTMNIGPSMGFKSGDVLDANATAQLVDDRINELVDGAEETLDTLKEISTAIPTKTSQLVNDSGFITGSDVISVTANQPFPQDWFDAENMSQLILKINNDSTATKGKIYLSTISLSDLPGDMLLAEMKAEIMGVSQGLGKNILFVVNSENTSPYHWEYLSAYGRTNQWRSYLPYNTTIPTVPTNISAFTNDAGYTTNVGTITGITMNGSSKGESGVIDLGTVITDISGKQDTINDLDTIRNGANAGATAYQKPSGGIPASDLTSTAASALNDVITVDTVWSAALADVYNEIQGIKARFNNLGTTSAVEIDFENVPKVTGYRMIMSGSGAPTDVPRFVGQFYVDTSTPALYCAKNITNSTGDWFLV